MKLTLLERLLATARTSAATAVVTNLVTGAQALVSKTGSEGELTLSPDALAHALQLLDDDRSGTLETAARMANHASTRTTQLYDRREEELTLDEVERILV